MPEAGEGDGVLVFGEDEVMAGGVVHGPLVVHIRVVADEGDLPVVLKPVFVNGHELLVQVLHRGTRGFQPVLEGRDVADVAVRTVELVHPVDGELDEQAVVLPAHLAGGRQLVRCFRPGDVVVACDDDVVATSEKCGAHLVEGLVAALLGEQFVDLSLRGACCGELHPQDVFDVLAAGFLAEVVGHVLRRGGVHSVAVVQRPVVVGENLVEVRHAAEERFAVLQLAGDDAAVDADLTVDVPDHAGFFRGSVELAGDAEVAGPVAVGDGVLGQLVGLHGAVPAPGDSPHLGAGERIDLLYRPVGERCQRGNRGRDAS